MSAFLELHDYMRSKLAWQEAAIRDQSLSPVARLIACQLMHDLHSERRGAWRSQESLAALIGVDVRTIRRGLAALAAKGYLKTTISRGRGHANFYEAIFPGLSSDTENRTPVSSDKAENRALVSSDATENRTLVSEKPDTSAPPYQEINLNPPYTPQASDTQQPKPEGLSPEVAIEAHWKAFEAAYPSNHATAPAMRRARLAFEGIVDRREATPQALIAAAAAYSRKRAGQTPDRTKTPYHWLREGCWHGHQAANCNQPRTGLADAFADSEIRTAVARVMGEPGAASYLDPATWRAIDRVIVCKGETAARALRERAGRVLHSKGVTVIADAAEHGRLAAAASAKAA